MPEQITSHWQNGGLTAKLKLSAYLSATSPMRFPLAGIVKDNTDIKKGRRKMKIETHNIDDTKIAEVNSDETIINNTEDGLDPHNILKPLKSNLKTLK